VYQSLYRALVAKGDTRSAEEIARQYGPLDDASSK
jgi:hypothetical protein